MIREKWAISKEYKEASIAILQNNLIPLRAKAGVTQEELSNILGISRQTYYALESGKKEMSWDTFLCLVFFFHELNTTREMIEELKAYPIEMTMKFNGLISPNL